MKVTVLRIETDNPLSELGTGKHKGMEIYPTTPTLLRRLKLDATRYKIPSSVVTNKHPELRPYQLEDVAFLNIRKSAGCFNEQRTGKTPTAITSFRDKKLDKVLIVAPASTIYQWQQEYERWYPESTATKVVGTKSQRHSIIKNWKHGALIISYGCLRKISLLDNEGVPIVTGDIDLILRHKDIEGIIVDEAHRIKNYRSKQAKACFSLSKIPNKIALSGTPAPGKPYEIYSILHFLYPTIFSGYWRFIEYYFRVNQSYAGHQRKQIGTFRPGKERELQEFLSCISTRRLRGSVMSWLPDKDREDILLTPTASQLSAIQQIRKYFEIEGTDIDASNLLTQLLRERQLCLDPKLLGLQSSSPKLNWIKEFIKDYPEKSIIVFSNFTSWLTVLHDEIPNSKMIIGETSKHDRDLARVSFQQGETKVLLVNITAGKEGLTLDRADVTIFTDKYPPIGAIQQAEDRAVATTKDMLKHGNQVITLTMKGTYEEAILKMLKSNNKKVDVINNYINYLKGEE